MNTNEPEGDGAVELLELRKSFGGVAVLKGVTLRAGHGEFVTIVGPSGCGKTTTLNIMAGFEAPDGGDVRLGGQSVLSVPSHRRGLGMVFQSHALFPHMTIEQNVGFGLRMRGVPKKEIVGRVGEALELVRLSGLAGRYPRELSGGQQQRVGIARSLTVQPRVILMDEPLSSLDAKLRREMQIELRRIQKAVRITAIYVTHDQEEALTLSDRIVLMNKGQIEQEGTPEEIYSRPATEFVAGFIGEANFFDGTVRGSHNGQAHVEIPRIGDAEVRTPLRLKVGDRVRLAVRPDRIRIGPHGRGFSSAVQSRAFVGPVLRYVLQVASDRELIAEFPAGGPNPPSTGETIGWSVAPQDWLVFSSVET